MGKIENVKFVCDAASIVSQYKRNINKPLGKKGLISSLLCIKHNELGHRTTDLKEILGLANFKFFEPDQRYYYHKFISLYGVYWRF
jgi:hypothetical protein